MDYIYSIGLIYVFALFTGIFYINKNPDLSFWLIISLYFDPGNYISNVLGNYLGRIDYQDILILFVVILIIKIKGKHRYIQNNILLKQFYFFFIIFFLYHVFVYGIIIPFIKDDLNINMFFLKNRRYFYGIIIMYGGYLYSLRGLKYLYLTILFTALVTLSFFWLSIISGVHFIEYISFGRYYKSSIMRITLNSYGIFDLVFPLSLIVLFLSKRREITIPYKRLLYFVGILMLLTLLITLSRRVILDIAGTFLIFIYLISKISKVSMFNISYKTIRLAFFSIIFLFLIKPNYINYVKKVSEDIYLLITTGKDTEGQGEDRMSGGGIYQDLFPEIEKNIIFGTGYSYTEWILINNYPKAVSTRGLKFGQLVDAATEIPILALFFFYGIIGSTFVIILYINIIFLAKKTYLKLKKSFFYSIKKDQILVIFSVYFIYWIIRMFTYNAYSLGLHFSGIYFQSNGLWFGIMFGIHQSLTKYKMLSAGNE